MKESTFMHAISDLRTGYAVAEGIAEYLLSTIDPDAGPYDEDKFDSMVFDVLNNPGYEISEYQAYALLGAALHRYSYDAELFFGVTSYGILGHYVFEIAQDILEND